MLVLDEIQKIGGWSTIVKRLWDEDSRVKRPLKVVVLGSAQLAENVGTTIPKAIAVVEHLELRKKPDCCKEFKIGSQLHKRYSQEALKSMQHVLQEKSAEDIWAARHPRAVRREYGPLVRVTAGAPADAESLRNALGRSTFRLADR